jgi:hypothetical protein
VIVVRCADHHPLGMTEVVHGVPSRKNSGVDTAPMPRSRNRSPTDVVVPTGTVDLNATTAPGRKTSQCSATTASTARRSADPSASLGVGTHTNTTSRSDNSE